MTTLQKVQNYLAEIERNNKQGKRINAILEINSQAEEQAKLIDEKIKQGKAGKLAGKVIAIKSNINVKNLHASCASKTLENYKSSYNATVINKILAEDGVIIGICNCDEFACGWSGENSAFGPTKNPQALDRIPGGSSSGSAAAVSAGFCDLALGSDTGGSVRNPASNCGVVGVKPTYGLVSRYGLIDLSMSLDTIAPIGKNIEDTTLLLNIIKGKDERDSTSYPSEEIILKKQEKIKVGIPKVSADKKILDLINKRVDEISKKNNWKIEKIELPHIDLAVQTYYPIVYVEFFSGTRKFDGRRYGLKIEDSCGKEVLRRILGGQEISQAEFAGKFYRKALQAKKLIKEEFESAFKRVDAIVMPVLPILPWKLGERVDLEAAYNSDALTTPANLAETPAVVVPAGKINNIPVGLQILCPRFQESKMLSIAKEFEN